jgi:serine-type D-Ala-D-Ala carboxypeptidase (penicillin-binding protein 5/6)
MQIRHRWLIGLAALAIPASAQTPAYLQPPLPVDQNSIAMITLLVDLTSGQVLHEHSGRYGFAPASMTKVMTALVVFDLIKAGKLDEDTVVTVRPETVARWAGKGTTLALRPNEQMRIGDLLLATTAASANDAAVALAEASAGSVESFAAMALQRTRQLGMRRSWFKNPNGYPDKGGTMTTAGDMATLARALINEHPVLYRRYFGQPGINWRGKFLPNRDPMIGVVPGADGIKTGFTREAGFTFVGSLERSGRRLVLVIGRAKTEASRANAARVLAEWGFSAWESRSLAPAGWTVGAARVQDGSERTVRLILPHDTRYSRPKGGADRPEARIVYSGPLKAPIRKGAEVARLEMRLSGVRPWSIPLVAAEDVARAGPIDRIVGGLLGLVE